MKSPLKIAIIGSPGSGKSTFALKVHNILHIPLFHIDQYFWKPNWQRPDREEFRKIHNEICDKPEWIVEGMAISHFDYRLERATIIIFIDVPLYICLYRIFKRAFLNFDKVIFSSAPGYPERIPDKEFLTYVWNFHRKQKSYVQSLLAVHAKDKKIFVVKNQHDLNELIKYFGKNKAQL